MDHLELFGFEGGSSRRGEEIIYRLVILYTRIFGEMSDFLKPYGLTPAKMNVLMIVKHQGGNDGIRQVDLSRRLMVTTSNMTRVLDKLQRDGLISVGNADDRRVKLIRITPKGSKLLDKVWPEYTRRLKTLTQNLPEDKEEKLSGLLSLWMKGLLD